MSLFRVYGETKVVAVFPTRRHADCNHNKECSRLQAFQWYEITLSILRQPPWRSLTIEVPMQHEHIRASGCKDVLATTFLLVL